MQVRVVIIMLLVLAVSPIAAGPTTTAVAEDAPLASPPKAGQIAGDLSPADRVQSVCAISRDTGKTYPGDLDAKTGKFAVKNLPGDAAYDVRVRTADGLDFEGIDLSFVDDRLLRLAARRREQLKLPTQPAGDFTTDDAKALLDYAAKQEDFSDFRRVLYVQGHGRRATMLVELMRTREFYESKGALVWRVELWYFENNYGGWERVPNQERVLRRERITPAEWRKLGVGYYPQLSVHVNADGTSDPVSFTLPAKIDPSLGRPPGSEPKLNGGATFLGCTSASSAP